MVYWLCSFPLNDNNSERTWDKLQQKTCYDSPNLSQNYKFELPDLRVGTLDNLLVLSDDLVKVSNTMEGLVFKIRRQLFDFGRGADSLQIDGTPLESYLTRFAWDEAKYPHRKPLKETLEKITENIGKIDDDLKLKVTEYNTLKAQMSAINRKTQGSLAVRDLSTVVGSEQLIESENLTTLLVVIPKPQVKEWMANYENMSDYVVPRSSRVLKDDNDYTLVTVVLFRRVADEFKAQARLKGFQVRDADFDAESQAGAAEGLNQLKADMETKKGALEEWCATAFGEAFSAWIHVSGIRLFCESILRYGLPPKFLATLMKPNEKLSARLRKSLEQMFGGADSKVWTEGAQAGMGSMDDIYPYVSYTINTEA